MSKKIIKTAFYGMVLSFLVLPLIVAAQPQVPTGGPTTVANVYDIFLTVMRWVFAFAMVLALIIVVWGGITYMTAGGDEEKVGAAKKRIIWGLVGIIIIIAAWALVTIIARFLGITVPIPA